MEDAYAEALSLNQDRFVRIEDIKPRSISILPIAIACQASCKFCFSDCSVSAEKRDKNLTPELIHRAMAKAKAAGAERAVITGGGEPTLVGFEKLNEMIAISHGYFPGRITLITNGLVLAKLPSEQRLQRLLELDRAGVTALSISRHHHDSTQNMAIMGVDTQTQSILTTYQEHREKFKNMKLRLICVLQKTGVNTEKEIDAYVEWAKAHGVSEVNFKELYVSTERESRYALSMANAYSEQNRVHLRTVLTFAKTRGWEKTGELPWGAPLFEKEFHGTRMRIAAYTEPSLFWERTHGIARSWNLMSDGKLLMSLETGDSEIQY